MGVALSNAIAVSPAKKKTARVGMVGGNTDHSPPSGYNARRSRKRIPRDIWRLTTHSTARREKEDPRPLAPLLKTHENDDLAPAAARRRHIAAARRHMLSRRNISGVLLAETTWTPTPAEENDLASHGDILLGSYDGCSYHDAR